MVCPSKSKPFIFFTAAGIKCASTVETLAAFLLCSFTLLPPSLPQSRLPLAPNCRLPLSPNREALLLYSARPVDGGGYAGTARGGGGSAGARRWQRLDPWTAAATLDGARRRWPEHGGRARNADAAGDGGLFYPNAEQGDDLLHFFLIFLLPSLSTNLIVSHVC
jgi:hypothetical protein